MAVGPPPRVQGSIVVKNSLEFTVYYKDKVISQNQYKHIIQNNSISKVSQLTNLMAFLKSLENETFVVMEETLNNLSEVLLNCEDEKVGKKLGFLIEQIKLLNISKLGRRYSPELLIVSYIIHSSSASAYETILEQGILSLPSLRTLKKVSKRLDNKSGLNNTEYLKMKISKLDSFDRIVSLMIDEIYLGESYKLSCSQHCHA